MATFVCIAHLAACGGGSDESGTVGTDGGNNNGDENVGGGGGGGNDDGAQPPTSDFANAPTAVAGQLLEMNPTNAISVDSIPTVTFRMIGNDGQVLKTVQSVGYAPSANQVWIVVPGEPGDQSQPVLGNVELIVQGSGDTERLVVTDYPSYNIATRGQIFVGQLRALSNASLRTITTLDRLYDRQMVTDEDRDRLQISLYNRLAAYSSMITEYERTGSVTLNDPLLNGFTQPMTAEALGRLDRAIVTRLAAHRYALDQFGTMATSGSMQIKEVRVPDWEAWTAAMQRSVDAVGGDDYTDLTFGVWDAIKRGGRLAGKLGSWIGIQITSSGPAAAALVYSQAQALLTYVFEKAANAIDRGDQADFDRLVALGRTTLANATSVLSSLPDASKWRPLIDDLNDIGGMDGLIQNIEGACAVDRNSVNRRGVMQLKQVLSCPFNPPSNGQFEPDYSQIWSSTYGDIHWGSGYYGNRTKTISRGNGQWDGTTNQYVAQGRWGRTTSDYSGGWRFTFDSVCSFTGVWWRDTDPSEEFGWTGSCR